MKRLLLSCLLSVSLLGTAAEAAAPKNALGAIAVSPDGETVLAAGDNRALYVINSSDLSVRDAIWLGINPISIFYASDGNTIVIRDTKNDLRFHDTATWEVTTEFANANAVAVAEEADILIAAGRPRGRGDEATTALVAYDMKSGQVAFEVTAKGQIIAIGISPDASRIVAVTRAADSEAEKKEKPPTSLKGIQKVLFQQQHDGKDAQVINFDGQGKETGRYTTWYSSTMDLDLAVVGDATLAISYRNINAELDKTGASTTLFETENSYNYGIAYSVVNDVIVTGGLATGTIMSLSDRSQKKFSIDKIGGWPEYFKGFAISGDGTIYGGTTAYRLIKIGADGVVEKVTPIF